MSKYKETVDAITASDALKERVMQQALHPDEIFADMRPVQYRRFAAPMMACMCLILAAAIAIPLLIINFGDFSPAWDDLPTDKVTWLVEPTLYDGIRIFYCEHTDVYVTAKEPASIDSVLLIIDEKTGLPSDKIYDPENRKPDMTEKYWIYDPALSLFGQYERLDTADWQANLYPINEALSRFPEDKNTDTIKLVISVDSTKSYAPFGGLVYESEYFVRSEFAVAYGNKIVTGFDYRSYDAGRKLPEIIHAGARTESKNVYNYKSGVIDKNGNVIVPFELGFIMLIDERSAFAMSDNGLWGIIAIPPVQPPAPKTQELPYTIEHECGVNMIIQSVSRTEISFVYENTTDTEFTYGNPFSLYVREDGEWISAKFISGNEHYTFTLVAYPIAPNSRTKLITRNWEHMFGELPDGEYKFGVYILNSREPGDFDTHDFEYEFTLPFVQAKPAPTVLEWTTDEENRVYSKQLQIHEFPGVIFERGRYEAPDEYREDALYRYFKAIYPNGEEREIVLQTGLGWAGSIFIADLTGDGYPEFIFTSSITSGIFTSYVHAYDFVNDEHYILDPQKYGGANVPFIENNKIMVMYDRRPEFSFAPTFELGFENGELILVGFLPVPSGVIFNVTSVSASKIEFYFDNPTDKEFMFGEEFWLYKYVGDEWVHADRVNGTAGHNPIGYNVKPNSRSQTYTRDWTWLYGELSPGEYMFSTYLNHGGAGSTTRQEFQHVFTIESPPGEQTLSERLAALFRLNGSMEVEKGALDAIIEESKIKTPDITDIKNVYTENLHYLTMALSSFAPSLANINHHFPIEYIRRVDDNTIEVVIKTNDTERTYRSLYFENLYGGAENEDYNADTELWWFKPGATSPGD